MTGAGFLHPTVKSLGEQYFTFVQDTVRINDTSHGVSKVPYLPLLQQLGAIGKKQLREAFFNFVGRRTKTTDIGSQRREIGLLETDPGIVAFDAYKFEYLVDFFGPHVTIGTRQCGKKSDLMPDESSLHHTRAVRRRFGNNWAAWRLWFGTFGGGWCQNTANENLRDSNLLPESNWFENLPVGGDDLDNSVRTKRSIGISKVTNSAEVDAVSLFDKVHGADRSAADMAIGIFVGHSENDPVKEVAFAGFARNVIFNVGVSVGAMLDDLGRFLVPLPKCVQPNVPKRHNPDLSTGGV